MEKLVLEEYHSFYKPDGTLGWYWEIVRSMLIKPESEQVTEALDLVNNKPDIYRVRPMDTERVDVS